MTTGWEYPMIVGGNEQRFTSPGTWTCPPTTTQVEVLVVGGGGGGGGGSSVNPLPGISGGGGGGRVIHRIIPVAGPVPVTVGAGGTRGFFGPTPISATAGGTSAFGPLGPGPVPAIPATTIAAGGGGAGRTWNGPADPTNSIAPPIGGGGGGANGSIYTGFGQPVGTGTYGAPGRISYRPDPSVYPVWYSGTGGGGAGGLTDALFGVGGAGLFGFGGGGGGGYWWPGSYVGASTYPVDGGGVGSPNRAGNPYYGPTEVTKTGTPGTANTGGGGGGGFTESPSNTYKYGGNGGSGVVIVRWA